MVATNGWAFRKTWGRLRRSGVYAGRVALAGCIVSVGVWALAGLSALSGRVRPTPRAERQAAVANLPALAWPAPLDLSGGGWQVAGLPWQLSVKQVPAASCEAELLRAPAQDSPAREPGEVDRDLLSLARGLGAQRREVGGHSVYLLDLGGARAALFTRGAGREERLILGRIVCGKQAESSLLAEAVPLPHERAAETSPSELLPLPTGSRRLATRRGSGGEVIAELVSVAAGSPALRDFWERGGRHAEALGEGTGPLQGLTCRSGPRTVYAWLSSRGGGHTLVLLVALSAEGSP